LATTSNVRAETEYPRVREPVSLANEKAFANNPMAAQSRAALMLGLGAVLCIGNRSEACSERQPDELLPPEDLDLLGIPKRIYELINQDAERYATDDLNNRLIQLMGVDKLPGSDDPEAQLELELLAISRLSDGWRRLDAALTLYSGLGDPDPLVRTAAACSLQEVLKSEELPTLSTPLLARATVTEDDLLLAVAATCLARIDPEHEALHRLSGPSKSEDPAAPLNSGLIVHGTWAQNGNWWPPGGEFHSYLATWVQDLYSEPTDAFNWSGRWRHSKRVEAAGELHNWTQLHGGNVIFLASHGVDGLPPMTFGRAVLLSVPVHRDRYWPNFGSFQSLVAVRVRLDLVVLADLGGQKFDHPQIDDIELDLWFDHGASHDSDVWKNNALQARMPTEICP